MSQSLRRFGHLAFYSFLTLCFLLIALPVHVQAQQLSSHSSSPFIRRTHGSITINTPAIIAFEKSKTAQLRQAGYLNTFSTVSPNWVGYFVGSGQGNGFKAVEGSWNAPCTSGSTDRAHDYSSWVGLGGSFNNEEPLEQTGITLQTDGTYRIFWEYWSLTNAPPFYQDTGIVHCGDNISAYVLYHPSACPNGFMTHIQDNTQPAIHVGSTCQGTPSTGLGYQSADWIDERPTVECSIFGGNGNLSYLADFNYTHWTNAQAQANSSGAQYQNLNSFQNQETFMENHPPTDTTPLASPGFINNNNTFTDYWNNSGTNYSDC